MQKLIWAIYIPACMPLLQETVKQKEKTGGNEQREDAECVRFSFAVLHDGKKQRRLNLI